MKRKLLAVIVLVGAAVPAYALPVPPPPPPPPAPTLTVSPATVPTGGSSTTILVEWSGIPNPTPGDWLGIYPAGVAPYGFAVGNPRWRYVDCQQHVGAGVQPVPAGVCAFDISGLAPGHYQTSLLANEGTTELARAAFTVAAGPPPLTLTVSPATVPAGGSVLVAWSGIPKPLPGDWLGIYPAGVAPHGFKVGNPRWKYVDCQQHVGAGVQPVAAGVCTFDVSGLAPGHYQTSLLANEGMTELARAAFTVSAGPPPLTVTVSPAGGSSTAILVEWSGIPNPMPGDWLGIYPAGVAPHGFALGDSRWKYVDCQQHAGAGVQPVAAGVCTFDVRGLGRGQYRASLMANEGFVELASAVFTVEAGTPPPSPSPTVSDWDTHPEPALPALPAAGGTMLDTVFGATIMRLTDENDGSDCRVEYSYWPTFNVDSTRVKALCVIGGVNRTKIWTFDPTNFQRGAALQPMATFPQSSDPIWSDTDPNILYGYSQTGALVSYQVVTQAMTTIKDFTGVLPSGGQLQQMSMSDNDDRFAFHFTNSSWQTVGYLVWDSSANAIVINQTEANVDEVQIDKSGRYLSVVYTSGNAKIWDLYTMTSTLLTWGYDGFFHHDSGYGTKLTYMGNTNGFGYRSLATPHTVVPLLTLTTGNKTAHFSMRAADEAWGLVSHYNNNGSAVSAPFDNEIFQVATDGSGQVRRWAHHRSVYNDYGDGPFANISKDGRFVAFSSNWGNANGRRDVFVVRR